MSKSKYAAPKNRSKTKPGTKPNEWKPPTPGTGKGKLPHAKGYNPVTKTWDHQ